MIECMDCGSNRLKRINADKRMMPPEDIYECRDCEYIQPCDWQGPLHHGNRSAAKTHRSHT